MCGEGSVDEIVAKYNISSREVLRNWIKRYNANKELKDYDPKREVYMAEARRQTTLKERKEITEYCIAHGEDYKGTAALYDVSYSQVYNWVRKYLSEGEEGLVDKRGHHKTDDEVDELERLRLFADERMHVNGLHDPMDPVLAKASPVKSVDPRCHPTVTQDVVILFVILSDQLS